MDKYKEALERAKKWYDPIDDKIPTYTRKVLTDIFPELGVVGDEQIKEALISVLKSDFEEEATTFGISIRQIIDWVNKQKPAIEMKSPEESLGISSEEYNDIVNQCIEESYQQQADDLIDKCTEKSWSKEDDKILQGIVDEIQANKSSAPEYDLKTYDIFLSWLKSLKERIGG